MLVFANFAGGEGDTACRPSGTLPQTPRVFAQIGAPSSSPGPLAGGAVPVSADRPHVSPRCPGRWQCVGVPEPPGLPALLKPSNSRTHWDITFYRRPLHLGVAPVPADKPHVSLRRPGRWQCIGVPEPPGLSHTTGRDGERCPAGIAEAELTLPAGGDFVVRRNRWNKPRAAGSTRRCREVPGAPSADSY